jgi:hypothetical protein
VNLVRLHVFIVKKANDERLVIFHQDWKNLYVHRFQ